jgi:hypothetical protein
MTKPNVKSMTNDRMPNFSNFKSPKYFGLLDFELHLGFELSH